jgi:Ras-related protein Rab-1A
MYLDNVFKILLIGNTNSGKSALLVRFVDNKYSDSYISTIGVDFKTKTLNIDDNPIKLQMWDTAGQDRFRTITPSYYKGADGIILAYDITNIESFDNLNMWLKECDKYVSTDVCKILVGNKCDLESNRQISYDEGKQYADSLNIHFFEVSSKNYINVNEIFTHLVSNIKNNNKKQINNDTIILVNTNNTNNTTSWFC